MDLSVQHVLEVARGKRDGSTALQRAIQAARGKNPHAVALGKLGGKKGGDTRAQRLSPERRQQIAQHAARTRWGTNGTVA